MEHTDVSSLDNLMVQDLGEQYQDVRNRERILGAINNGQKILFYTNILTDATERQLDFVVAGLLKRYGRESMQSTVYSAVKELVVNATRANAKLAWFEEQGLNIHNPDNYARGMERLKGDVDEAWIERYGRLARERGHIVQVHFLHNSDGLRIEVWNAPMLAVQESRIREKFSEGMGYDDLVQFYMAYGDQTEGEGLGLVMTLLLLKAEGVNPHLFRIGVKNGYTVSRIEIPLSAAFRSVRGEDPAGRPRD